MNRHLVYGFVLAMFFAGGGSPLHAASVYVPNGSFESPQTEFVDITIDVWQKSAKPWWYVESPGQYWIQLTGLYLNLPPEEPRYIDNCDGKQAIWLFAVPEVELFQKLEAMYEVGKSYTLTVGVIGGGFNMKDGTTMAIRLYYQNENDPNNRIPVAETPIVYHSEMGYPTHFQDVELKIPRVIETDPWTGKNIGIQLVSTLIFPDDLDPITGRAGGFWDLDHVRLNEFLPGPDYTGDGIVNLIDFAELAREWLACDVETDLTGDGCVDLDDLNKLAESWLQSRP
jgi:hypothetical protein